VRGRARLSTPKGVRFREIQRSCHDPHPGPLPEGEGAIKRSRATNAGCTLNRPKLKFAIKAILTVLVLAFVARHVVQTWRDLSERGESLRIDAGWVALAVGLYLVGLTAFGVYFWRVLKAGATPTSFIPALRAYLISHLGKYVPGKAMVVVMRAGLVVPYGARPATAAFATLYETLVMMATGGLVAGVGFAAAWGPSTRWKLPFSAGSEIDAPLGLLGFGLGLAFLIVVWPSVFPRLAGLAKIPLPGVGPDALPRFSYRLLLEGVAWSSLGWVLLGLSQVAVIRGVMPEGLAVSAWPLAIASVALATVAGFVVPISPGGLGVREWVLWTALASALDRDLAVVAALVLRLAWLIGEVLAAAVLTLIRPPLPGPTSP
jgi:glycosyltransferase 2 family protein